MQLVQILLPGREPVVLLCDAVEPDADLPGRLVIRGPRDFELDCGGRSWAVLAWRGVPASAIGWIAMVEPVREGLALVPGTPAAGERPADPPQSGAGGSAG